MVNRNFEINARWQDTFFDNVEGFIEAGIDRETARNLLQEYIDLAAKTTYPLAIQSLSNPTILEEHGTYTQPKARYIEFVTRFISPLVSNFKLEGLDNLPIIKQVLDKFPVTIVCNHSSHFDTAALFTLLYNHGGIATEMAKRLVLIAGRPVYQSDFTRVGLYSIGTLLVFSLKDLEEQVGSIELMNKVNMRSFRSASKLQKEGKIITLFPEGTRSRTGQLLKFVDAIYHYVANQLIIPISLTNTNEVLQPNSFKLRPAHGKLSIGTPIFLGKPTEEQRELLPKEVSVHFTEQKEGKKAFYLDTIAVLIAKNLQKDKHGVYRNLYNSETEEHELITIPNNPEHTIVIIGDSKNSTSVACMLANKNAIIYILILDESKAKILNAEHIDSDHYPLFKIPPNIMFTSNSSLLEKATLIIQGVHPWELELYYPNIIHYIQNNKAPIVNIRNGFTNSKDALILKDLTNIYKINPNRLATLSGAKNSDEIMERKFTAFQLSTQNEELIPILLPIFNLSYITTKTNKNIANLVSIELAGALTSTYAIALGLIDAYYEQILGGNNENAVFHFAYLAFEEMVRLGTLLGGDEKTFYTSSGLGSFMLACFGIENRDRNIGFQLLSVGVPLERHPDSSAIHSIEDLSKMITIEENEYPILYHLCQLIIEKAPAHLQAKKIIAAMQK